MGLGVAVGVLEESADERNRIRRVPVKVLGGCTGSSGTEDTKAAAGETGAEGGCRGERGSPIEDADADPAVAANPATAASTCAKARPDPKDRRPTPTRAVLPKWSLDNNRPVPTAPVRPAVGPTPPLSFSA